MTNPAKERAAETAAAAALIALLSAAVAMGAMVLERVESGRTAAAFIGMAQRTLVPAGSVLTALPSAARPSPPVRRIFTLSTRDGRAAGTGMTVIVEGDAWSAEMLILMDEHGRIVSYAPRDGGSGVRAEELAIFLRQRGKNASGGLSAAADARELEFAVNAVLETALRFSNQRQEAKR